MVESAQRGLKNNPGFPGGFPRHDLMGAMDAETTQEVSHALYTLVFASRFTKYMGISCMVIAWYLKDGQNTNLILILKQALTWAC